MFVLRHIRPATAAPSDTERTGTPVFTAFKKFCLDTGADPDKIRTLMKSRVPIIVSEKTDPTWQVTAGNRHMLLTSGVRMAGFNSAGNQRELHLCMMVSGTRDDASLATLREWVGVEPAASEGSAGPAVQYQYVQTGETRTLPSEGLPNWSAAFDAGNFWTIMVNPDRNVGLTFLLTGPKQVAH